MIRARYDGWYYFDSIVTNPRHSPPQDRRVDDRMLSDIQRLSQLHTRGKHPLPELRHGSTWWALTDEAVARILEVHDTNLWLCQILRVFCYSGRAVRPNSSGFILFDAGVPPVHARRLFARSEALRVSRSGGAQRAVRGTLLHGA